MKSKIINKKLNPNRVLKDNVLELVWNFELNQTSGIFQGLFPMNKEIILSLVKWSVWPQPFFNLRLGFVCENINKVVVEVK